uniref:Cytochrome b n=1 Tax=Euciroa cf. queenslandica STW-2017 TaxID=1969321 RepID=A0A1U9XPE6_9BIVA|nr:cytochrome b [Euciroa cf. queenslandica STW-2017]AQZ26121.1 cytochrome b [Euciroa cf. queenslandica STW-2017]
MYPILRKSNVLMRPVASALYDLPAYNNLSSWWSFGSMLGLCLIIQIVSGLVLSLHYTPHTDLAFSSIIHIMRDVNYGWLIRSIHANGASLFFACMYLHIGRGIYYGLYRSDKVWNIGVVLYLLTMVTAFLGYVLPWGQMSYWGATVISNMLGAVPYVGKELILWVWGGFSINNATLARFFVGHFLLPFIILVFVILHILFLHEKGSSNPLGVGSSHEKVELHPYFTVKDMLGFLMFLAVLVLVSCFFPTIFLDPINLLPANPFSTPTHIQPEWYFLFAYTILRAVPNKVGGVLALVLSVMILLSLPLTCRSNFQGLNYYPHLQMVFWFFIMVFMILTWCGMQPVEYPFNILGSMFSTLYFMFFLFLPVIMSLSDMLMF